MPRCNLLVRGLLAGVCLSAPSAALRLEGHAGLPPPSDEDAALVREMSEDSVDAGCVPFPSLAAIPPPQGADWRNNCTKGLRVLCNPRTTEEYDWVDQPPELLSMNESDPALVKKAFSRPKMALLMMANASVDNVPVWEQWLSHAKKDELPVSFLIHAHDVGSGHWESPTLRKYLLNTSADNRWCKVGPAEWLLLETALKDPEVTHLVMVSSDSVPVKPLHYMYKELRKEPATRMCLDWEVQRKHSGQYTPRAETWFVMHRADALFFLRNRKLAETNFMPKNMCQEERMWAMPLIKRSYRWGQRAAPLLDECVMFTDWGDLSCKPWARHVLMGDFSHLRASKSSQMHGDAHPKKYFALGEEAARELKDSPFWFARKFRDNAVSPKYMDFFNMK